MEPNPWSNYNQHYSRISRSNVLPGSMNRYDMPLMDQPGLNSDLGSLSSTLSPSHSALPTARPMASLAPMAYSHPLHNMPQFLDPVNPLPAGFADPSYKVGVSASQSAYPMDSFLASRVHHESALTLPGSSPSYMPQHSPLTSPDHKPLFSPDLFSRDIKVSYPSGTSNPGAVLLSSSSGDSKGSWGLSNFAPSSSAAYSDIGSYSLGQYTNPPSRNIPGPTNLSTARSSSQRHLYHPGPGYNIVQPTARSPSPGQSLYQSMSSSPASYNQLTSTSHSSQHVSRVEGSRIQEAEDLSRATPAVAHTTNVSQAHQHKTVPTRDMYIFNRMYEEPYHSHNTGEAPTQLGSLAGSTSDARREKTESPLLPTSHFKSSTPHLTEMYSHSLKPSRTPTPTHNSFTPYAADMYSHSLKPSRTPMPAHKSFTPHLADMYSHSLKPLRTHIPTQKPFTPHIPEMYSQTLQSSTVPAHSHKTPSPHIVEVYSPLQSPRTLTPTLKPSTPHIPELYSQPLQSPRTPTPTQKFYTQYSDDYSNRVCSGGTAGDTRRSSLSQIADMKYDPVSPPAPMSEAQHGETLSTISLHDLNSISSHSDVNLIGSKQPTAEYGSSEKPKRKKSKEQSKKKRSKSKSSVPSSSQEDLHVKTQPPQSHHNPNTEQLSSVVHQYHRNPNTEQQPSIIHQHHQNPNAEQQSSIIHQHQQNLNAELQSSIIHQHHKNPIAEQQSSIIHQHHQNPNAEQQSSIIHQYQQNPNAEQQSSVLHQNVQHQSSHVPYSPHTQHESVPEQLLTPMQHHSTHTHVQSPPSHPDPQQDSPHALYPHPRHEDSALYPNQQPQIERQDSNLSKHERIQQQNPGTHYQSLQIQTQQPHLQHQHHNQHQIPEPEAQYPRQSQNPTHHVRQHSTHTQQYQSAEVKPDMLYLPETDSSHSQAPSYSYGRESPTPLPPQFKEEAVSPVAVANLSSVSLTDAMSSNTVIQSVPPPIQAVADSTTVTKPKRGRGRRKKQAKAESAEKKLPVDEKPYIGYHDKLIPQLYSASKAEAKHWAEPLNSEDSSSLVNNDQQDKYSGYASHQMPVLNPETNTDTDSAFTQNNSATEGFDTTKNSVIMKSEFFQSEKLEEPMPVMSGDSATKSLDRDNVLSDGTFAACEFNIKFEDPLRDENMTNNSLSNQLIDAEIKSEEEIVAKVDKTEAENPTSAQHVPKAVVIELEFDDDFQHLVPVPSPVKKANNIENLDSSPSKDFKSAGGSDAFLSSFVSFISGKKAETLSSVTQSPVKRPPLPKYYPEPRRVKPESQMCVSEGEEKIDNGSDTPTPTSSRAKRNSEDTAVKRETVWTKLKGKGERKTLGSRLAKLSKVKKPQNVRNSGDTDEDSPNQLDSDAGEVPPAPTRRRSTRHKDGVKRKYVEEASDEDVEKIEEEEVLGEVTYTSEEEVEYDSDKDPVWTPFEKKQNAGEGLPTRIRRFTKTSHSKKKSVSKQPLKKRKRSQLQESVPPQPATKPPKRPPDSDSDSDSDEPREREPSPEPEPAKLEEAPKPAQPETTITKPANSEYQRGTFLIEKRDLTNYENFPVWRVSDGKMLQKYELIIDKGVVKHKSTFTYSSWTPLMHDQFQPVQVKLIMKEKRYEIVEVEDSCRPKPPTDGSLERQYEDNPMVESFNVFLQILLSQALEPGFLKAIHCSEDKFYLGHMAKVDEMIQARVKTIQKKVRWTKIFKAAVKKRPFVRELDRPNLQQSCQASKDKRQPAIKSVHLFGDMYDSVDLSDKSDSTHSSSSEEFLIGKTATTYLMTYHSLVHYKYNLYKRCMAKVNLVKESEGTRDNAEVLDACLHNRSWVLKLFEDLKTLLDGP